MTTGRSAAVSEKQSRKPPASGVVLGVERGGADRRCGSGTDCRRSVSAVCAGPTTTTPPCTWRIRPTRRRMNARMTISPMSASVETRRRKSARLTRSSRLGSPRARADQHLALVEEVELAGELARAQDEEDLRQVVLVDVEDLDRAFEDDEEVDAAIAAREDRRAGGEALLAAVARDPRQPSPRSGAERSAPRARSDRSRRARCRGLLSAARRASCAVAVGHPRSLRARRRRRRVARPSPSAAAPRRTV